MRRGVDPAGLRLHDRRVRVQVGAGAGDQLAVHPGRRCGDVRDADLLLRRALGDHLAVDDVEVLRLDLELLRRDLEQLLARRQRGLLTALPATKVAREANVPGADRRRVRVRVVVRDPLVRDAERLGDDLALDRLRAVADVGGAGEDVDAAVRLDLDPRLRRVAVLVHAGRVLDRRDPAARVLGHSDPPFRPGRRGARGAGRPSASRASSSGSRRAARARPRRRSRGSSAPWRDPCRRCRSATCRRSGSRSSAGSRRGRCPSTSAMRMTCSSVANETDVTPKPRMAVVGTRFVNTT